MAEVYERYPWIREAVERVSKTRGFTEDELDFLAEGDNRLLNALANVPLVSETTLRRPPYEGRFDDVLSPRMGQICRLVLDGLTTREIADVLGIGIETVKTHKKLINKRMDVRHTWQAAVLAEMLGILPK